MEVVFIHPGGPNGVGAGDLSLRCPACRHQAILQALHQDFQAVQRDGRGTVAWGARRCPNPECGALILVIKHGQTVISYPAETIDFDASDLPERVLAALEEAVKCHAEQCYVASAIMVRKTLEEVCAERGAGGPNLKERLDALRNNVNLPEPMFDALQDLRLLGNDAAHIESQVFNKVDQEEVEIALDITKEILKATYQLSSIMNRLEARKKASADPAA